MSTRISRITAILGLNRAGFSRGLRDAGREASMFGRAVKAIGAGLAGVGLGRGIAAAFKSAMNRESLLRSIAATNDGLRSTEDQFKSLQTVANNNAQSVSDVAAAFVSLRGAALSSREAERTVDAVGNALNRMGRGADFDSVMTNFRQIAGNASITTDELKETAAYMPEILRLSKLRFGSADGEGLSQRGITGKAWVLGMTEALAEIERQSSGASGSLMKLESAWEDLKATAGKELITPGTNLIGGLTAGLQQAASDFSLIMQNMRGELEPGAPLPTKEDLAAMRAKAAKEAAALEAKRLEELEKAAQTEMQLGMAAVRLAEAKASRDDEAILKAETELAILKEKEDVMKRLDAKQEEAIELITERVRMEQRAADIQRDRDRAAERLKNDDDLEMLEAQAQGEKGRRMKRRERKVRLKEEDERLRGMGISDPARRQELAERTIKVQDNIAINEDRRSKGLAPRIRTYTGEEALRRNWSRMGDEKKEGFARLGLNDSGSQYTESGYEVFRRKNAGGIEAHRGDPPMRVRRNAPDTHETGRASEGQTASDEAVIRELQGMRKDIQALQSPSERLKPRRSS